MADRSAENDLVRELREAYPALYYNETNLERRAAAEIERLRTSIDRVHSARLAWAMSCQCTCASCDAFYEFVRDTLPDCSPADVSPPQE